MGLSLQVGYLADLLIHDEDGAENVQADWGRLNEYLASIGLPAHSEPTACEVFSCDMYGYSGLHYLRRIAAHLDLRGQLPAPSGDDASEDDVLAEYHRIAGQSEPGLFARLFRRIPRAQEFDYLILHSDAEGYYLPQDFSSVLFPPDHFHIPGGMIGSAVRLQHECERLAGALELPLHLVPESDDVCEATKSQGVGDSQWQRYGIESYTCLQLHAACVHSLRHGAAIVFC